MDQPQLPTQNNAPTITHSIPLIVVQSLATLGPIVQDRLGRESIEAKIQYNEPDHLIGPIVTKTLKGILTLDPSQERPFLVGQRGTFFIVASYCHVPRTPGPWCHYSCEEYDFFGDLQWFLDLDTADVDTGDPPMFHVSGRLSGIDHVDEVIKLRVSPHITTIHESNCILPPRPSTLAVCEWRSPCKGAFEALYPLVISSDHISLVGYASPTLSVPYLVPVTGLRMTIQQIMRGNAVIYRAE